MVLARGVVDTLLRDAGRSLPAVVLCADEVRAVATRHLLLGDLGSGFSVDAARRSHPLTGLTCDPRDEVEVAIVVQHSQAVRFGRRGDEQVRHLPPTESAGCQ